ncbi:hypothetical protein [Paenibacillus xylanexedens]|uniref:hypothetical protein n=1 Tax=Paenibacillus xylanexedens TaxID=528191 RepID=UPI0016423AD8|nr:hypothetical protein [Paenibacillus xylanexedens]
MGGEICELVGEGKVGVGDGEMCEREVEKRIVELLDGEYDVVVRSSMIERGVDIGNVNRLMVDEGEKMGVSELYELGGGVGGCKGIGYG